MNVFYVVITELATGAEVERMGPMPERKADTCLMGVLRQLNHDAYAATTEPTSPAAPKEQQ